jgi:hypothetical protein
MNTTRPALLSVAATIAFLVVAAALTPDQSPILPIEISVVLLALGGWVALRRSRPAYVVLGGFAVLLTALTVHIVLGDLGDKGPRELVPDFLILGACLALDATALRAAFPGKAIA